MRRSPPSVSSACLSILALLSVTQLGVFGCGGAKSLNEASVSLENAGYKVNEQQLEAPGGTGQRRAVIPPDDCKTIFISEFRTNEDAARYTEQSRRQQRGGPPAKVETVDNYVVEEETLAVDEACPKRFEEVTSNLGG